jgi:excisionase family DNA binding protein
MAGAVTEFPPELLTVRQVASLCSTSPFTFRKWMRAGTVPSVIRLGPGTRGSIRFRRSDVTRWIEAGCPKNSPQE